MGRRVEGALRDKRSRLSAWPRLALLCAAALRLPSRAAGIAYLRYPFSRCNKVLES